MQIYCFMLVRNYWKHRCHFIWKVLLYYTEWASVVPVSEFITPCWWKRWTSINYSKALAFLLLYGWKINEIEKNILFSHVSQCSQYLLFLPAIVLMLHLRFKKHEGVKHSNILSKKVHLLHLLLQKVWDNWQYFFFFATGIIYT